LYVEGIEDCRGDVRPWDARVPGCIGQSKETAMPSMLVNGIEIPFFTIFSQKTLVHLLE
jgi:hypothetical protein